MLDAKFEASELVDKCRFSNEIFAMISSQKAKLANPKSDRMYSNQSNFKAVFSKTLSDSSLLS